ncbi:uncharacterized protein EAE97_000472 [Botrytis byssoidea]|uniref:N-acetyltransferase domain-containing protein n=1 Tax=Botrytis byssoidea TaxID=139641 RepID=A0A9P5M4C5_9HELO|nr:uncharacterized protein EAE97_000472 [Botrytis byssoidea]KAF7955213.1 hypothetical protein EAE97_000472 [Botrytis byssoidea]
MADFPTKAHEKRKAGGENPASHLKPSNVSKKTKIDRSEKISSTEEDVSPVNSEKTIIDLTADHSASPFTSSLVSELVFDEFDEETHDDFEEYRECDYDLDDKCKYESGDDDDDYSPKNIETKVHILKGTKAQCMLSIHVTKAEQDNKWLDNIRVECSHKGGWVGRAVSRYIHRQGIKSNFLNMMESPSCKMEEMANELFIKFGCLLRKFEDHVIQRGTGAWGAEMDVGPLVLLEEIEITDKRFRRKGLGRAMVKALIQKSQAQAHHFRRLHSNRERRATKRQALDSAIAFYRSLGFRRIGSSSYFGFSVDPKHKAHSINVHADYDPPRVDEELEIPDDEDIVETSSMNSFDEAA